MDAYGYGQGPPAVCAAKGADPLLARAETVAVWIRNPPDRPSRRLSKDSLRIEMSQANATIQQRLVAVLFFSEYSEKDGLGEENPVRRGQAERAGRRPRQRLARHSEQTPWIPNENVWERILAACAVESLRNRQMVALAYDGALRREELIQLDIEDTRSIDAIDRSSRFTIFLNSTATKVLACFGGHRTITMDSADTPQPTP
ncbi:hypothetical protein [Streptomyces sp. NPDC091219]|uniref:hypothetical protein n=1 Tax=Streptomyces sp. NPDC091219 TaxID=3155193 RepID=UPI00344F4040